MADSIAAASPPPRRLEGVDVVRGLVMVLMVLDHARDYFVDASISPTDLGRATPGLFLTRWVTHFCAPTFALLAGVGARLAGGRGAAPGPLARSLLTRGLWLILLEATVVKFGLLFRPSPSLLLGLVLWAIGGAFVIVSAFVAMRAPAWIVGLIGLAVVALHNGFDGLPPDFGGPLRPLATFLLRPGLYPLPGGFTAFIGYPLLPWFGVVAVGYWLGGVYAMEAGRRRVVLAGLGLAAVALFAALRASGAYGDPQPWRSTADPTTTILSFLNCTKYPPSLQYLLMTLGPALAALAALDRGGGRIGRPLATLGRAPLFFYLLQWYVIHGLALAVAFARGEPTGWLFVDSFPIEPPPSSAFGLPALYLWWMLILALLYPPVAWFARYKDRNRGSTWLRYM